MSKPKFTDVYKEAYGWTIDVYGNLCGLVAGDVGYEWTDTKLEALILMGLRTQGNCEVATKIHELVDACFNAITEKDKKMNSVMHKKVEKGEAIDLSDAPTRDGHYYVIDAFVEDKDYCILRTIQWIWSVGKRKSDGVILASTSGDLYQNPDFECLWLR